MLKKAFQAIVIFVGTYKTFEFGAKKLGEFANRFVIVRKEDGKTIKGETYQKVENNN